MKTLNWLFNLGAAAVSASWCLCVTIHINAYIEWNFSFVEKVYESNYKSNMDSVPIAMNTNFWENQIWEKELMYCSKYSR